MIQIAEFGLAQLLFCLSTIGFLAQIYHLEIPLKRGLVKAIKGILVLALMVAFVLSTVINVKIKGRKAWSNLWAEEERPAVQSQPIPNVVPSPSLTMTSPTPQAQASPTPMPMTIISTPVPTPAPHSSFPTRKPRQKRPTAAELDERRRIDRDLNYNEPE
jgi:hypothetical protein